MQDLFLTFRNGTSAHLSVPDDFGHAQIAFLLDGDNYLAEFDTDNAGRVTIAIRGADMRTAVLTTGGKVLEQPNA